MAKRNESLSTSASTSLLDVNINATLSWRIMMITHKMRPINVDCATDTMVANPAPLPFPAPSSFATLTLEIVCHRNYQLKKKKCFDHQKCKKRKLKK